MEMRGKQKGSASTLLLTLVFLLGVARFFFPMGCQAATTCKVYFRENAGGKGTDGAMEKLTASVRKGKKLTLPALPERTGYLSLGWTSEKKGQTVQYQAGDTVTIQETATFYAVRQKKAKYKIKFRNNKGSGGAAYKALSLSVYEGDTFTLPALPAAEGYESLGWTTSKGGKTPLYLAGSEVKAEASRVYYAVRQKSSSVSLCFFSREGDSEGFSNLNMMGYAGQEVVLPEAEPKAGCTFLGWSLSEGRETNPEYLAGAKLTLSHSMNLYAVMFPTIREPEVTELPVGWQQVYRKIVFVGDSRTNRMAQTLKVAFGLSPNLVEVHYVCAEGKGLSWLKETGKDQLVSLLGYGVKPAAVIFNLGVNDLGNAKKYVNYLSSIKAELSAKNCRLYCMSVNPVSHPLLLKSGRSEAAISRSCERVIAFNQVIRDQLCSGGDFTYLDLYSYLISNGFRFDSGGKDGRDTLVEDGLHYSGRTYKRIFTRTIALLLGQA